MYVFNYGSWNFKIYYKKENKGFAYNNCIYCTMSYYAFTENATSLQTTMAECMKKIEELKKEIDTKDKEIEKLKKQVENVTKLEQDKNKLFKEVNKKIFFKCYLKILVIFFSFLSNCLH